MTARPVTVLLSFAHVVLVAACGAAGEDGTDAGSDTDAAPVTNTTLSGLTATVGVLDPPFQPEIAEYHLDLVLAETATALTPTAAVDAGTTITVDGEAVASGTTSRELALTPGSRDVEIVVAGADGSTTYTVHVHRGVDALIALEPSAGTLTPLFEPATTSYALGLGLAIESISWTPTAVIPDRAAIDVEGQTVDSGTTSAAIALAPGTSTLTATVTPATRPARAYAVQVDRGVDALASVALSYGGGAIPNPLMPAFDPATANYSVDVGLWMETLELTATPLFDDATISVNGAPVGPGESSEPITLNLGLTEASIVVTSPDGPTTTYTIDVNRGSTALQEVYAKASNADGGDMFGSSVALWGDTLVIGAPWEDSAATGVNGNEADNSASSSGAVYVFERNGSTWTQQAYIKASNTEPVDRFGSSVAVWGDTLAVGASREGSAATGVNGNQSSNGASYSGAVYVFARSGSTWSQQAYIKASNTEASDNFGERVALWEDTLAVSATDEDSSSTGIGGDQADNSRADSGAVYVFTRSGGSWSQEAYVKASNTDADDGFGSSIALWRDTLAVGAPYEDSAATGINGSQGSNSASSSGAVYVFTRSGTSWTQQAYIKASNAEAGDRFGVGVALWDRTLAVGAMLEDSAGILPSNNAASNSGAAYVFAHDGTSWSQQAYVKASNPESGDWFGSSVALSSDTLAVGAPREDSQAPGTNGDESDNQRSNSGAVYVYIRTGTSWSQETYVKASNPGIGHEFGRPLALWGDTLAAAAAQEGADSGAVYVLR